MRRDDQLAFSAGVGAKGKLELIVRRDFESLD